ncbi:hypothetical protein [Pseudoxanthomonas japonensis]|uniref:hypothetical protein n=1 Tax=Pseudoxanthomonas japonensis TaxID=69284 RepID=UPI001BCF6B45|nr:hypothetical protein [Pseudoxanthomonas japonensis]
MLQRDQTILLPIQRHTDGPSITGAKVTKIGIGYAGRLEAGDDRVSASDGAGKKEPAGRVCSRGCEDVCTESAIRIRLHAKKFHSMPGDRLTIFRHERAVDGPRRMFKSNGCCSARMLFSASGQND